LSIARGARTQPFDAAWGHLHRLHEELFDVLTVGLEIWRLDDRGALRLVAGNRFASAILHVNLGAAVGRTMRDIFPFIAEECERAYLDTARSGVGRFMGEIGYSDSQANKKVCSCRTIPLARHCMGVLFEDVDPLRASGQEASTIFFTMPQA
jgi:hypothetical protein